MMPNDSAPGDDFRSEDERLSETEQTTAETGPTPELSAETNQPDAVEQAHDEMAAEEADAAAEDDSVPAEAEVEAGAEPEPEPAALAAEEEDVFQAVERFPEDEADETDEADEAEASAQPEAVGRIRPRAVLEGTIIDTSPTEILVDLGEGITGVVASREMERMDKVSLEALESGKPVMVYVLKADGPDGRPVLSLARAEEESNWQLAESYHQHQEVYFTKVAGYNKGGLIVRFGKVRGFVPASQVSRERQRRASGESPEERWGSMVGEDIAVKVVELDRGRNRLILSERAASREAREQQKARLLEDLEVGEVRRGRVISVADFGAFVDLGGADGLVHLTELSWKHVTHPRDILEVGQEVEVQVITIDRARKRIGLSMKRQEQDPWEQVVRNYGVGQLVQATVTKLTKFGAFARLVDAPEIEGLIHISELADYRVNHPRDVVLVGDVLTLRIVKIDSEQRRLGLSLRQVDSAKYMDQDWQAIADEVTVEEAEPESEPEPEAPPAAPEPDDETLPEDEA
jgi:small subunit ribosomal protein S1